MDTTENPFQMVLQHRRIGLEQLSSVKRRLIGLDAIKINKPLSARKSSAERRVLSGLLLDYHNFIDKTITCHLFYFSPDLIKSRWETNLILLVFMTLRRRSNLGEFCV